MWAKSMLEEKCISKNLLMFLAQMQMNMAIMIRLPKLLKFKLIHLGQINAFRNMRRQEPADVFSSIANKYGNNTTISCATKIQLIHLGQIDAFTGIHNKEPADVLSSNTNEYGNNDTIVQAISRLISAKISNFSSNFFLKKGTNWVVNGQICSK